MTVAADTRGSERLPREHRIARRREFLAVYQKGMKIHSQNFVLYIMRNALDHHRLGVTVSRRIGKAVVRNRVKRRLREIFRRNRPPGMPASDIVINARAGIAGIPFSALAGEIAHALRRARRGLHA